MAISDQQRGECSEDAFKCHGTAYIFERRAASIRWKLRLISFVGIATPASLGVVIGMMGSSSQHLCTALWIAGAIGFAQLILSIWSIVSSWGENLAYYIESKSENYRFSEEFTKLARQTDLSDKVFQLQHKVLEAQSDIRLSLDHRIDIKDKEKRRGMRAALWKFKRKCSENGCATIPTSLKSTKCNVCGNFRFYNL